MADDERNPGAFKPSPAVLAGLLDRDAAARHADAIARNPQITELKEELERIDAEARREEEERARQPAPASEKAEHVEAVVPHGDVPRITSSKVKIATEARRLRPPPTIVHDDSPRGMPTMEVRVLAPVARTERRRAGWMVCAVAFLVVGVGVAAVVGLGTTAPSSRGAAAPSAPRALETPLAAADAGDAEPPAPSAVLPSASSPPSPSPASSASSASSTPPRAAVEDAPRAPRSSAPRPTAPPAVAPPAPSTSPAPPAPPGTPAAPPTVKHNPVFEFGGDTDG